mmetsp:Transcript_7655/g.11522  ORF Transcript_7655/g.11522 Transcript_7655/m.11522 type:complete len:834 (-) Transcript_7655:328-2829(-)
MMQRQAGTASPGGKSAAPPVAGSQSYFQPDNKKGEVNELKTLLRDPAVERDPKRKRDVIKKVIAYMTLGIDVSRLFTEMVMSIETRDLVVKKMVYHYLSTYAHEKPEMGIMCINTLQRDCSNEDPMVRGLALRSLCSLRLPSVLEYIETPLRASLTDQHSYVRKTGVMGILKVYHLDKDLIRNGDWIDILYDMLRDVDGTVVTNCIVVLDEIMLEEGGIAINTAIIHHLLGRLNDFNEWGLGAVLRLVTRYEPESDQETYGIMNILDPVLRTSNSGVVLEAIGCFVALTEHLPELHQQVYDRIKSPLLTLMAGSAGDNFESVYCLLKHAELLVPRCREAFASEYRNFYIRYDEPSPVKHVKVKILAELATETTADEILAELKEYASDAEAELGKNAIRSVGTIAARLRNKSAQGCALLVEFLELEGARYIKAEALLVAKDVLRRYPERRFDILPSLARYLRELDDSAPLGRAAAVWIVGNWGQEITEAPYLLESLIDDYTNESNPDVKLALLCTATRLFFKRPPEMQAMLGRLLQSALEDQSNTDVRDRALFYLRLLRTDIKRAKKVIDAHDPSALIVGAFAENTTGLADRLFEYFNTLAIVFGQTPDQFVNANKRPKDEHVLAKSKRRQLRLERGSVQGIDVIPPEKNKNPQEENLTSTNGFTDPFSNSNAQTVDDLLGNDDHEEEEQQQSSKKDLEFDLLGGGAGTDFSSPPPALPSLIAAAGTIDPNTFQTKWTSISIESTTTLNLPKLPSSTKAVDAALASQHIYTMASGELPAQFKFFFYARDTNGTLYLVQCLIDKATTIANLTTKIDGQNGDATLVRDILHIGLTS